MDSGGKFEEEEASRSETMEDSAKRKMKEEDEKAIRMSKVDEVAEEDWRR